MHIPLFIKICLSTSLGTALLMLLCMPLVGSERFPRFAETAFPFFLTLAFGPLILTFGYFIWNL